MQGLVNYLTLHRVFIVLITGPDFVKTSKSNEIDTQMQRSNSFQAGSREKKM